MYIAVDLKVIEVTGPGVARALGAAENAVVSGLVRMWHGCWSLRRAVFNAFEVRGFFGLEHADLCPALVAFGFLESVDGGFRVRGAERYLRIADARSAGGHASKGNLKRGLKSPGSPPADSRLASGSLPALTPSTEHRAPSPKSLAGDKRPRRRQATSLPDQRSLDDEHHPGPQRQPIAPPDPRHAPLVKALVDASPGYVFDGGRDAKAVTLLLAKGEPAEVEARWRRALARTGFPTVRAIHELVQHWNHFAADSPQRGFADITEADRRAHATEIGILEAP